MTDQILPPENVRIVPGGATRDEAIREAGRILVDAGAVDASYIDSMLEREATVSTYMGNWLAIPHGTNEAKDLIRRSAMSLLRYEQPIDWGGEPARFVVGIAGLEDEHLEILSKIAIVFSDEEQVDRLLPVRGDALEQEGGHAGLPPRRRYSTAIRTLTPFETCSTIVDRRGSSATSAAISIPRFIGPGCMTIARSGSSAIRVRSSPYRRLYSRADGK